MSKRKYSDMSSNNKKGKTETAHADAIEIGNAWHPTNLKNAIEKTKGADVLSSFVNSKNVNLSAYTIHGNGISLMGNRGVTNHIS